MIGFLHSFAGSTANSLGWRVADDQVWITRFDPLQLPHQLIELRVTDLGIVLDIVEPLVPT